MNVNILVHGLVSDLLLAQRDLKKELKKLPLKQFSSIKKTSANGIFIVDCLKKILLSYFWSI